jgi:signal transduction histidine kinase
LLHGRPETRTQLTLAESLAEVHPEDRSKIQEAVQAALKDRAPQRIKYRVVLPDGSIRWIELVGRVFLDETGRPAVVRGVGFDITESQDAYEELARRKATLRRLIEVQENERQMLCHELHDGPIQYAIGAKMMLESDGDEVDWPTRGERLKSAVECLTRVIAEGRQIIRGVRSAVLDDLGLAAAIEDLRDQMATMHFTVEVNLGEGLDSLEPSLCSTVYRVVQKSLSNARKHAGVDRASVEIHRVGDEVHLRVVDRGTGFQVDEDRTAGFGIVGMTERVRLAGGSLWIDSQPGAGSQVNARLPM